VTPSSKTKWIFEVIHPNWNEWPGNELYSDIELAKFWGIHDYTEDFLIEHDHFNDHFFEWVPLGKGTYLLYEDSMSTEIEIRVRALHIKDSN